MNFKREEVLIIYSIATIFLTLKNKRWKWLMLSWKDGESTPSMYHCLTQGPIRINSHSGHQQHLEGKASKERLCLEWIARFFFFLIIIIIIIII